MKHIKKILSAALLCALVFSGCTVRAEATFKGKTESEWENSFKTTATTTLEKTGTPPDAMNGFIVRVEGEDRISDTISGSVDESEAYSGGKALKSNFKRDDSVTKGRPFRNRSRNGNIFAHRSCFHMEKIELRIFRYLCQRFVCLRCRGQCAFGTIGFGQGLDAKSRTDADFFEEG